MLHHLCPLLEVAGSNFDLSVFTCIALQLILLLCRHATYQSDLIWLYIEIYQILRWLANYMADVTLLTPEATAVSKCYCTKHL